MYLITSNSNGTWHGLPSNSSDEVVASDKSLLENRMRWLGMDFDAETTPWQEEFSMVGSNIESFLLEGLNKLRVLPIDEVALGTLH